MKILEMLVKVGADLEDTCPWGWSVMQWLLGEGNHYVVQGKPSGWGLGHQHKEVALFLLDRVSLRQVSGDWSRNRFGETIIHWAARGGYEEVARTALKKGVDPKVRGGEHIQLTAFELAIQQEQSGIAELLTIAG
jgi:ankyrin repeat protein